MRSIKGFFFPQEGVFFELLEEESKNVTKAAVALSKLILNFDHKTGDYRRKIKDIEHAGDRIVAEIHKRLNSSFITPIDHEDIADLANTYDDVLDGIYTFVNRLQIYDIKKIDATLKEFAELVLMTTREVEKAFCSMKKLSQKEIELRNQKVKKLERDADDLLDRSTAALFKKRNFVEILKFKELYEILEGTTDKCMDVVDIMRNIVLKHS